MRIKRLLGAIATAAITLAGLTLAGSPAHAEGCGRWWPDGGKTIQSYNPGTSTYTATTYFTFSQANITAFKCEGQKYMEVDQMGLPRVWLTPDL